jgi:hypothetical protein
MSQKQLREYDPLGEQPDLRSKPQRRAKWNVSGLFLLFGFVLVLAGGGVLGWQAVSHQLAQGSQLGKSSGIAQQKGPPSGDCSHGGQPHYNDILKQFVAQGLHLTVTQVAAEIRSGKKIADVAAEQGVSPDQLFSLEIQAYQSADTWLISIGCMNPYAASRDVQSYRDTGELQVNDTFTYMFAHVQ